VWFYTNVLVLARCIYVLWQIFTAAPPFAIGMFDRYCSVDTLLHFPALYKSSQNSELFNVKVRLTHICCQHTQGHGFNGHFQSKHRTRTRTNGEGKSRGNHLTCKVTVKMVYVWVYCKIRLL